MYLDTRGYVNVGVGKMLPPPSSAQLIRFVRRGSGDLANVLEIQDAFFKVRGSIAGRPAISYRHLTDLDLAPGEADRLLNTELEKAENGCRDLFGGWDKFPLPAQLALLDMVY